MRRPEAELQRAIVATLRWLLPPGVLLHHSAHEQRAGGAAGRRAQAVSAGMGVQAGWPDLVVVAAAPRQLFLEVKAPGGRVSPAQRDCHERLRALGWAVAVVHSVDEALDALERHGIMLRSARVGARVTGRDDDALWGRF